MPRHEHEQQRGKALLQQRVRLEDLALLARVRARGDPDGALAAPVSAQYARLFEQPRRDLDVELEVARHVNQVLCCAEIAQTLRVDARLGAQQIGVREHGASDVRHPQIAAQRRLRHAAVHE